MSKDPRLRRPQQLRQQVLNLELLAYNFHESLDIGPLFKDVRSQIPDEETGPNAELRARLERVAREVTERQLTAVFDTGMVEKGDALPEKIPNLNAYLIFGAHTVSGPDFRPGDDVSRLCLSMDSTDEVHQYRYLKLVTTKERHYRQFKLEIIEYDRRSREVQVRLYASRVLSKEQCLQPDLSLGDNQEVDSSFWVGLFDFPMIDNTRLTHGERCAVSLTALNPEILTVALSYFPGSRASLKDKPYYDDVMHDLVRNPKIPETINR